MSPTERRLLIWCGVMLLRSTTLTPAEADEIDQLIAAARSDLPPVRSPAPTIDYAELSKQYAERYQRRGKIIGLALYYIASFIVMVTVLGGIWLTQYRAFSNEWTIHVILNFAAYGAGVFLYWLWGTLHKSSRDKTIRFLKSIPNILYGTTRNIIGHWR